MEGSDGWETRQYNVWSIEGYLKTTFFPNLIFNEIHGTRHFFFSESRSGPTEPTSSKLIDVMRLTK
jgi:hypothetical protein